MLIAFDGRALSSPAGGIRRYVGELWRAMQEAVPDVRGIAVGGDPDRARVLGVAHQPVRWSFPTNPGWCAWALPRGVARTGAHVFHAPAYTAPLWGARPLVVTLHDVSYERHPEWYPHQSDPLRRAFYRYSARRADLIITDSQFSQKEITAAYGIDPARIHVVPLGVSPMFSPCATVEREPVVLHVGDLHPRRNLLVLWNAVRRLRREHAELERLRLVLIGTDRGSRDALMSEAARDDLREALVHIPQIEEEGLRHWYRKAAVFGYPSRYEGFGLPLLEAMACGTPVVASRASSIPEVTGDAVHLIDPRDADDWIAALRDVLCDRVRAEELSSAGLAQAARFTWTTTARMTADVWREAAARAARARVRETV
jgi:glycosyltransferase involved in cell wall biosynthesis